jgi:hypothetical protein
MRHGATDRRPVPGAQRRRVAVVVLLDLLEMRSWIALVWLFSVIVQNHALKQLSVVLVSGMARVRPEVTR